MNFSTKTRIFEIAYMGLAFCNRFPFPYQRWPIQVGQTRMVSHTFDRFLALWLWKFGWLEGYETSLLSTICRPGMRVLDIGANIGYYSLLLAQYVGDTGHIWAFEPDLGNYETLQLNLQENNFKNVEALNCAVGDISQKQSLYVSTAHNGDHRIYLVEDTEREKVAIDVVALDDFFAPTEKFDLIKMDIQGAEGLALVGMQRILTNNPNLVIFMEFWPKGLREAGSDPEQVLKDLIKIGFLLKHIDEKQKQLIEIANITEFVSSLTGEQYVNILVRSKTSL